MHFGAWLCGFSDYLDSGYLVRVARLLVYMWPPTSMWTGALDFVSCAGVGMPWLFSGDAGDLVIRGLDILGRLSYREISKFRHVFFCGEKGNPYILQKKPVTSVDIRLAIKSGRSASSRFCCNEYQKAPQICNKEKENFPCSESRSWANVHLTSSHTLWWLILLMNSHI